MNPFPFSTTGPMWPALAPDSLQVESGSDNNGNTEISGQRILLGGTLTPENPLLDRPVATRSVSQQVRTVDPMLMPPDMVEEIPTAIPVAGPSTSETELLSDWLFEPPDLPDTQNLKVVGKGKGKASDRSHTEGRPRRHECTVCSKKFIQSGHLKEHLHTHAKDKPHKCMVCEKSFSVLRYLKTHMHTHNKDRPRPHKCTVCDKGFFESKTLKNHMRTHTGEKPYACKLCERSFPQLSNLQGHIRKQHP